jgi:hypothetical protein
LSLYLVIATLREILPFSLTVSKPWACRLGQRLQTY